MKYVLLVINAGSSSLKFAVFVRGRPIRRGLIENIGGRARLLYPTVASQASRVSVKTMSGAFILLRRLLAAENLKPTAVAHRIVHGGQADERPTRLTPAVLRSLRRLIPLAPLHMPANVAGVRLAEQVWPRATEWGVFDTGPYHRLPEHIRLYALPWSVSKRFGIRKYGFHGISHRWALLQAGRRLGRPARRLNAITVHLGAGDSITRWRAGRAEDTTMGFTPLEGLAMATRSGDLDPMIPLFLQSHGYARRQVVEMLEQRSGLFGLTGLRDMRDIVAAAGQPVPGWPRRSWTAVQRRRARLAMAMFVYDIQRYLSSYIGLLPRLDAVVFTGAIGQNRRLQQRILRGLPAARGQRVLTIPTDEEQAIAEAVGRLLH